MRGFLSSVGYAAVAAFLLLASTAQAQWDDEVTEPAPPAPAAEPAPAAGAPPASTEQRGLRLAFQSRLVANLLGTVEPVLSTWQPSVAMGVRAMDDRLFVGLGVGLFGFENDFNAVTFQPTINVDLLRRGLAALYLVGWVPVGVVVDRFMGERETMTLFGTNVGVGLRAQVHENVAIGSEWGWGFGLVFADGDNMFFHGAFGSLMLEVSFGL
jgi:hypothetical protein